MAGEDEQSFGKAKLPCVVVGFEKFRSDNGIREKAPGAQSTYCFDIEHPILLGILKAASRQCSTASSLRFQGMFLPRGVSMFAGPTNVLTATVDQLRRLLLNRLNCPR